MSIQEEIRDILKNAGSVTVLTGAGVSAESGVATFRDPDGLWSKFNPSELASMDGFLRNPETVWSWYNYRRELINKVKPNAGHFALAEMQKLLPNFTLITQNIDRLHQEAGSNFVIELHGNLIDNHCSRCKADYFDEIDINQHKPPVCPHCGGLIRPSVVWFGEDLPVDELEAAAEAAEHCDVFISVGTNAEVFPAGNLPLLAKEKGAVLIEINPNYTVLSDKAHFCLKEKSGLALPKLVKLIKS